MTNDSLYLVTGASGFVGGHLVELLRSRGLAVRALVRSRALAAPLQALGAEVVVGDLLEPSSLEGVMDGVHGVFHIAALFRQAGFPDETFRRVNVEGTRALLDMAARQGVSRFVHCSTVGVLGHIAAPPADEKTPYNPGDVYQRTKMEGEKVALDYFKSQRVKGVVIRPAMIYGPGDTRMLKLFRLVNSGRFVMLGKGDVHVHFVDVRDLVRAFLNAMNADALNGEVYTVGGRSSLPLRTMVELIAGELGVRTPRLSIPVGPVHLAAEICERICIPLGIEPPLYHRRVDFFTKNRQFDCTKAWRDLSYRPAQSVEGEVRDVIKWYREHGYLPTGSSCMPDNAKALDYFFTNWNSRRVSIMVRRLNGAILSWNLGAAEKYGWDSEETIGSISHEILKTDFPQPLERINERLIADKQWRGELVHSRRDGTKTQVESSWVLKHVKGEEEPLVVETNIAYDKTRGSGRSLGLLSHAGTCGVILDELTNLCAFTA